MLFETDTLHKKVIWRRERDKMSLIESANVSIPCTTTLSMDSLDKFQHRNTVRKHEYKHRRHTNLNRFKRYHTQKPQSARRTNISCADQLFIFLFSMTIETVKNSNIVWAHISRLVSLFLIHMNSEFENAFSHTAAQNVYRYIFWFQLSHGWTHLSYPFLYGNVHRWILA